MIIYSHQPSESGRSARGEPPLAPGVSRVRFGKETLFFSEGAPAAPAAASASRGARFPSREVDATREQLHIVVQNGRLFQHHHPEVPVLHDRGRFLLVQLDPARARSLAAEGETCFGVLPLAEDGVAFDERAHSAPREPAAAITKLLRNLSRSTVEQRLTKLVGFGTRHATSPGFAAAVTWARDQLNALDYSTALEDVPVPGGMSRNVIADRTGSGAAPRKLLMITAHLDSINLQGGPSAAAPGADDNASGSAGLLEIARVLRKHPITHDLRLILFGGEELGLFGSKAHLEKLSPSQRRRIAGVVNMDMIGSLNNASPTVLVEGGPVSQPVMNGLGDAAATYTKLAVETSLNPFNSDHVPFIKAGVPAVLTIEGADSTNETVHSAGDTLQRIDYDLLLEILRMNVAFAAERLA